eukprot:gene14619-biopygen20113
MWCGNTRQIRATLIFSSACPDCPANERAPIPQLLFVHLPILLQPVVPSAPQPRDWAATGGEGCNAAPSTRAAAVGM